MSFILGVLQVVLRLCFRSVMRCLHDTPACISLIDADFRAASLFYPPALSKFLILQRATKELFWYNLGVVGLRDDAGLFVLVT